MIGSGISNVSKELVHFDRDFGGFSGIDQREINDIKFIRTKMVEASREKQDIAHNTKMGYGSKYLEKEPDP